MQPAFGKIIKSEAYHKGELTGSRIEYQIPEIITNRNQAMGQIIDCLTLLDTGKTHEVTLTIQTDKQGEYKMVTRRYAVEEKS